MAFFLKKIKRKINSGEKKKIPRTVTPVSELGTEITLSYHVGNLQGLGSRQEQEDSFCIMNALDPEKMKKKGLFFAVCDGMGGMKNGREASETAITSLQRTFETMGRTENLAAFLKDAVGTASLEVEQALDGQGGSTVVAGVIYEDRLYYVSVGDSCLFLRRKGNLYRLNRDHNVRDELYLKSIRKGITDPTDGRSDPEKAALTQFLGMHGICEVDCFVKPLPMMSEDVILVCSDGVGGALSRGQLYEALEGSDPVQMCRNLEDMIEQCNNPYQDNYTAVIIRCCK